MNQYKKSGYILILTMIILSSLSILLLTIIKQSQTYYSLNQAFYHMYNHKKYILDSIVIIKDLLLAERDGKENKDQQGNEEKEKNPNARVCDFFQFYWMYANRWLEYSIVNQMHHIDAKIKMYITCNDGKLPVSYVIRLFENASKKLNNSMAEANKKLDAKNQVTSEDLDRGADLIIKNNPNIKNFLAACQTLQKKENNVLEQLFFLESSLEQDKKKMGLDTLLEKYMKKTLYRPVSLIEFYTTILEENQLKDIYKKVYEYDAIDGKKNKKKSISDFASVTNMSLNPLFYSPVFLSVLGNKAIELSDEMRSKIIKDGIAYIEKQDTIENEKFWQAVIEKNCGIAYPKDFFDNEEIKKIISKKIFYPQYIEVILEITVLNRSSFVLINFEKNLKYDKTNEKEHNQNREYLLTSIQIFPTE